MRKLFLILMTLIACSWTAFAQTRTVSGVVVSSGEGEPIVGATVIPVGGGQGTATDIDGRFHLNVPNGTKEIQVSYVGMHTIRVKAEFGKPMRIELTSSASNLDEVMVVAYGTAKITTIYLTTGARNSYATVFARNTTSVSPEEMIA